MKKTNLLMAMAAGMLLASCGNNPSSTPSSEASTPSTPSSEPSVAPSTPSSEPSVPSAPSSEPSVAPSSDPSIPSSESSDPTPTDPTFDEVFDIISAAASKEAAASNGAHTYDAVYSGSIRDVLDENWTVYSNEGGYSSTGTVMEYSGDEISIQDNVSRRGKWEVDRFLADDDGQVYPYNMFVQAVDYENDSMIKNSYQDDASKRFIVASAAEAEAAGLSSNQYVTEAMLPLYLSANVSSQIFDLIYAKIYVSNYVAQTGKNTFKYEATAEGYKYSFNVSYNYPGDYGGDTITETIATAIEFNSLDQMTAVNFTFDYVDGYADLPASEAYTTGIAYRAAISYGDRVAVPSEGLINTDDYFLESIDDVEFFQPTKSEVGLDGTSIIFENDYTYLNGRGLGVHPSKALVTLLTPVSSSNPSAAKIEKGGAAGYIIHIVGTGDAEITFQYTGKVDGVYKTVTITKSLHITLAAPSSISFGSLPKTSLAVGDVETYGVIISPTASEKTYTVSTDVEGVVTCEINKDNDLVVTATSAGTVTVTIASTVDSNVKASLTITVTKAENLEETLCNTTYICDSYPYLPEGSYLQLIFNADHTGTCRQYMASGKYYDDDFTWSLNGTALTFEAASGAYFALEEGTVTADGGIDAWCEGYKHLVFVVSK